MKRIAFLLLLAGCVHDPFAVDGVRPATDREVERALVWYSETASCLELPDVGHRVHWWIAEVVMYDGDPAAGGRKDNDIWIAEDQAHWPPMWRHEAMHHILDNGAGDGDRNHTDPRWGPCVDGDWSGNVVWLNP